MVVGSCRALQVGLHLLTLHSFTVHSDQIRRSNEFIRALKGIWTDDSFTFKGDFYQVGLPFRIYQATCLELRSNHISMDYTDQIFSSTTTTSNPNLFHE